MYNAPKIKAKANNNVATEQQQQTIMEFKPDAYSQAISIKLKIVNKRVNAMNQVLLRESILHLHKLKTVSPVALLNFSIFIEWTCWIFQSALQQHLCMMAITNENWQCAEQPQNAYAYRYDRKMCWHIQTHTYTCRTRSSLIEPFFAYHLRFALRNGAQLLQNVQMYTQHFDWGKRYRMTATHIAFHSDIQWCLFKWILDTQSTQAHCNHWTFQSLIIST